MGWMIFSSPGNTERSEERRGANTKVGRFLESSSGCLPPSCLLRRTLGATIKVLAFAWPYYRDKYGFTASQSFSLKIDDTGGKLFVVWNGGFIEHETDGVDDTFGQVAVMAVNIPESKREE